MHTCRFCNLSNNHANWVKYAARHWAHYDCWLHAKGPEIAAPGTADGVVAFFAAALHDWQIRQFPVFVLADWLEMKKNLLGFPAKAGKSWVDKACWVIKSAIADSTPKEVQA